MPIVFICFAINCSMKNELSPAIKNFEKEADKCVATFDKTIATADRINRNIEKIIENLEKNRSANYSTLYKDSDDVKK